ncbi:MAG: PEP-CTERM sorting domain-containing protein [Planctomycetota bacterium]
MIAWLLLTSGSTSNNTSGAWLVRPVPEPSTALLLTLGLVGIAAIRRRGGGRWSTNI